MIIGFDGINRRESQTLQPGNSLENLAHEKAQAWFAGQVDTIGSEVDAGEYSLTIAAGHKPFDLRHNGAHWNRARGTTSEGNDAKGAAVVATVLDLDEGT